MRRDERDSHQRLILSGAEDQCCGRGVKRRILCEGWIGTVVIPQPIHYVDDPSLALRMNNAPGARRLTRSMTR